MDFITAAKLAELRKQNGYSQEALAEKLGLSRQAISKWERAESSPDTDNLIALASLYGMTLDGLLNTSSASLQDTPQEPTEENSSRGEQEKTDLKKSARTEKKSERKGGRLQRKTRREQIKATPAVFPKAASFLKRFPYIILAAAVFVILGYYKSMWHPAWVLFVTVPVYYGFAFACRAKNMRSFFMRVPVFFVAAFVYLCLGFGAGLWHPYWVVFLAVPMYYWIAAGKKK